MQIGLIGLGKWAATWPSGSAATVTRSSATTGIPTAKRDVDSLEALAAALSAPRVVWVMVPSGEPTRATVASLGEALSAGDIIIDGGNSRYTDDQAHAAVAGAQGHPLPGCRRLRRGLGVDRGLRADGRR